MQICEHEYINKDFPIFVVVLKIILFFFRKKKIRCCNELKNPLNKNGQFNLETFKFVLLTGKIERYNMSIYLLLLKMIDLSTYLPYIVVIDRNFCDQIKKVSCRMTIKINFF